MKELLVNKTYEKLKNEIYEELEKLKWNFKTFNDEPSIEDAISALTLIKSSTDFIKSECSLISDAAGEEIESLKAKK